jgi:putative ABC transport system ATP-binding protein
LAFIDVSDLTKYYGKDSSEVTVLTQLNLTIESGDFVALMGPSGSGKSTLLNLLAGIDSPTGGTIRINGVDIHNLSPAELCRWRSVNIGFIFQFYNLMPSLTALENVEMPLLLTRLDKSRRRSNAKAALALVGMSDRETHKPRELSGGQQQRVAIARAIVSDPAILVCDEPTGDLDRESADSILELLRALSKQHKKTIVMVTHDPKAAAFAGRILNLEKGALLGGASGAASVNK